MKERYPWSDLGGAILKRRENEYGEKKFEIVAKDSLKMTQSVGSWVVGDFASHLELSTGTL